MYRTEPNSIHETVSLLAVGYSNFPSLSHTAPRKSWSGDLQFQINYVTNVQGKRVYLANTCIGGRTADHGAVSVAATVVFGYVGMLIQGGDKKVAAGTQYTVYVDQDAKLQP